MYSRGELCNFNICSTYESQIKTFCIRRGHLGNPGFGLLLANF